MGCDADFESRWTCENISIHAPQWGATSTLGVVTMPVTFQSTHPSGVRPLVPLFNVLKPIFQSTHPSGVRLKSATLQPRTRNFNPRTPVGCDSERHEPDSGVPISIHAPQWGATCGRTCRWSPDRHFNPRTPVGCDPTRIGRPTPAGISIHAPQWGATEEQGPAHEGHQISIHAPQWGATLSRRR